MAEIKVKRLAKGKGVVGPEFIGCVNTGSRPCLHRSIVDGAYMVGQEFDVSEVRSRRCFGNTLRQRTWKMPNNRVVKVFQTRQPAVALFVQLVQKRIAENQKVMAEAKAATEKTRSGDYSKRIEGAFQLNDLGLL